MGYLTLLLSRLFTLDIFRIELDNDHVGRTRIQVIGCVSSGDLEHVDFLKFGASLFSHP